MLKSRMDSVRKTVERAMPDSVHRILARVERKVMRAIDFVSPAPAIEGIPRDEQEQSLCRLVALKVKRARGAELPFADLKKLALSDVSAFPKNSVSFVPRKLEIDTGVRPLVQAINSKDFLFSAGSCSGHMPKHGAFDDSGFVAFYIDEKYEKTADFVQELENFCRTESEKDPECTYTLENAGTETSYFISWAWNNEVYQRKRAIAADDTLDMEQKKELYFNLYEEQSRVTPLARELDIHGRHMAFVERLTKLIGDFGNSAE
jgi:hypothetical protein